MAEGSDERRVRRRRTLRTVLLGLIGLLFAASIPWYRDPEAPLRIWLGLPDWAAVALVSYALAALANAAAWRLTPIDDGGQPPDRRGAAR